MGIEIRFKASLYLVLKLKAKVKVEKGIEHYKEIER
jgi:hypothetical protein